MMALCQICHKRKADFEDVICYDCKKLFDELDFSMELKAYEEEMLASNHWGETCWLTGQICRQGSCRDCQVYCSWKEECNAKREVLN